MRDFCICFAFLYLLYFRAVAVDPVVPRAPACGGEASDLANTIGHMRKHNEIMKLLREAPAGTLTCAALAIDPVLRAAVEGAHA